MANYYIKLNISPKSNFVKIWNEIYQTSKGAISECSIYHPKELYMTVVDLGNISLSRNAQSDLKVKIKDIISKNHSSLEEFAYDSKIELGDVKEYAKLDISDAYGLVSLQQDMKVEVEKILKNYGVSTKIITLPPQVSIAKDKNVETKFNDLKTELDKILINRDCTKFGFDSCSLVAGKHEEYIDFSDSDWGDA